MESHPQAGSASIRLLPTFAKPRAMTRCECSGVTFEAVARRMEAEGLTLTDAMRGLNVGQLCTACQPDLATFVRARASAS